MAKKNDLDFCTGKFVDFSEPEESVRQETEKWLVSEMGYDKSNIDIRVRVRVGSKNLESDIVVYRCERANNLDQQKDFLGIVETKAESMADAERQLKSYMAASSSCEWGVAATKHARQFYRRHSNRIERIHAIPVSGMSINQVARLSKSDLSPAVNLKLVFKSILFHLYSNTNIQSRTRLCNEMTKILFCKIYDERLDSDVPHFQCSPDKTGKEIKFAIEEKLWKPVLSELQTTGVFQENEGIILDSDSLVYVVGELERLSLLKTDYDVVGAAFEVFAERYFVGEKGEFFTPRVAVKNAVKMLDPEYSEMIIDPACGSGGFLVQALEYVWNKITNSKEDVEHRQKLAPKYVYGIDKEPDLVKVARSYMSLIGDGHASIVDADSLKPLEYWKDHSRVCLTHSNGKTKQFDLVMTNPPFGSNIKIEHDYILNEYELGHLWQKETNSTRGGGGWNITQKTKPTSPQILFLELCVKLLKGSGRLCIVLPEGILANPTEGYVRQWLLESTEILAVWDCPQILFLPHTSTKTCILFLRKKRVSKQRILMSHILKCGHDKRGSEIRASSGKLDEEFSVAVNDWFVYQNGKNEFELSCLVDDTDLDEENRMIPRDHLSNPNSFSEAITLRELEEQGLISLKTMPCGVKQREYSDEGVPYLRTSDIGVMEIRCTQMKVPYEVYEREKVKQDVIPLDILIVKDGGKRIGEPVILLEDDAEIVVQGHFYKIRVLEDKKLDPFFLYWAITKSQPDIMGKAFVQSTLSSVTKDRMLNTPIPFPPTHKQVKIGTKVKKVIEARKECLRKYSQIEF